MSGRRFLLDTFVVVPGLCLLLAAAPAAGQQHSAQHAEHHTARESAVSRAIAVLSPTKGSPVRGVVTFEKVEKGVHVVANVTGLTPGKHGFHVHEFGDCSADDASSAGGHFNPTSTSHGGANASVRHAGDMGNLEADKDGNATLDYVDPVMKLTGEQSILGHAVIVHEKEDDLKSQPTGNAGGRVACGVVGVAKTK